MKTPGQIAYGTDVERCPIYPDGSDRKTWDQLPQYARDDWERHPTPRQYRKPQIRRLADISDRDWLASDLMINRTT